MPSLTRPQRRALRVAVQNAVAKLTDEQLRAPLIEAQFESLQRRAETEARAQDVPLTGVSLRRNLAKALRLARVARLRLKPLAADDLNYLPGADGFTFLGRPAKGGTTSVRLSEAEKAFIKAKNETPSDAIHIALARWMKSDQARPSGD